jgi:hypothetical protein
MASAVCLKDAISNPVVAMMRIHNVPGVVSCNCWATLESYSS